MEPPSWTLFHACCPLPRRGPSGSPSTMGLLHYSGNLCQEKMFLTKSRRRIGRPMTGFSLLSSHGLVLLAVAQSPSATLREIGDSVGLTERSAHRVVKDLVESGYLKRSRVGRRNQYAVVRDRSLPHALTASAELGDLLAVLESGPDRSH